VIPYAEDVEMLQKAAEWALSSGRLMLDDVSVSSESRRWAAFVAEYAQARFSAFANVHWCVVNDVFMPVEVRAVAKAMRAREPWGTLLTSHQRRGTGFTFTPDSPYGGWSDIVTLQTEDALCGSEVAEYRAVQRSPVVVEEVSHYLHELES
jgi:hypothetical protein